jgi:hypothetical protein
MNDDEENALERARERLAGAEVCEHEAMELLEHAQGDVGAARAELDEILLEAQEPGPGEARVHVKDLIERDKASFKVRLEDTLQAIWDLAYLKLKIAPREKDILQADHHSEKPTSLMDHLGLSLEQARRLDLCDLRFEIATGTGGA